MRPAQRSAIEYQGVKSAFGAPSLTIRLRCMRERLHPWPPAGRAGPGLDDFRARGPTAFTRSALPQRMPSRRTFMGSVSALRAFGLVSVMLAMRPRLSKATSADAAREDDMRLPTTRIHDARVAGASRGRRDRRFQTETSYIQGVRTIMITP